MVRVAWRTEMGPETLDRIFSIGTVEVVAML